MHEKEKLKEIKESEKTNIIYKKKKFNLYKVKDKAFDLLTSKEMYKLICNGTYYTLQNTQNTYQNPKVLEYKELLLLWGLKSEVFEYILKSSKTSRDADICTNFITTLIRNYKDEFDFGNIYYQLLREIDNMGQFESFYPKLKKIESNLQHKFPDYFKYWTIQTNNMCYEKLMNEDYSSKFATKVNALNDVELYYKTLIAN